MLSNMRDQIVFHQFAAYTCKGNRSLIFRKLSKLFLCIGVTFANFQSSGTVPALRETLNMLQETGAIWLRGCRFLGQVPYRDLTCPKTFEHPQQ